jgi:predicted MPP superfamily phosphohydrolase
MLVRLYDYSPMSTSSESTALTWLHLSDLHFGHGDAEQRFDQKNVTREILRDASEVAGRLGPPDLIIVTGDIAFSADPDAEYEPAARWIEKLVEAVGGSLDRVLVVPGNHDVNRDLLKHDPNAQTVHEALRAGPKRLNEFLNKPASMNPLWDKFSAFAGFTGRYGAPQVALESPFWVKAISHPLGPIKAVGLNTGLLSFDDEDAPTNLALSLAQVEKTLGLVADGELVLVLQHHPTEWLTDGDALEVRLLRRPHVVFCGHLHKAGGTIQKSLRGGGLNCASSRARAMRRPLASIITLGVGSTETDWISTLVRGRRTMDASFPTRTDFRKRMAAGAYVCNVEISPKCSQNGWRTAARALTGS